MNFSIQPTDAWKSSISNSFANFYATSRNIGPNILGLIDIFLHFLWSPLFLKNYLSRYFSFHFKMLFTVVLHTPIFSAVFLWLLFFRKLRRSTSYFNLSHFFCAIFNENLQINDQSHHNAMLRKKRMECISHVRETCCFPTLHNSMLHWYAQSLSPIFFLVRFQQLQTIYAGHG